MTRLLLHARRLPDFLYRHPWLTFVLMGAAFILFGFTSVNLFMLFAANIRLFIDYGTMVIADGALTQLLDLLASALLSALFFLFFALCDRVLVRRLTEKGLRERPAE